jgi:hypothetical protein
MTVLAEDVESEFQRMGEAGSENLKDLHYTFWKGPIYLL